MVSFVTDNKKLSSQRVQDEFWSQSKSGRRSPDHPVVRAVFSSLADIVAATVEDAQQCSVLDIGCGNGFLQWSLEQRFGLVVGIDYSIRMLEVNPCSCKNLGLSTAMPFDDGTFDVAVASHLLHHLPESDRLRTIREMKRVARRVVVSIEPNCRNLLMFLFALWQKEERMALSFSRTYMERLFTEAGLPSREVHVEGWIVPNKAPLWYLPLGRFLNQTPLKRWGFDIVAITRDDLNAAPS